MLHTHTHTHEKRNMTCLIQWNNKKANDINIIIKTLYPLWVRVNVFRWNSSATNWLRKETNILAVVAVQDDNLEHKEREKKRTNE